MNKDVGYTQWNIGISNEILPFVATCMDPENSILNEVTERKTNYLSLIHKFCFFKHFLI